LERQETVQGEVQERSGDMAEHTSRRGLPDEFPRSLPEDSQATKDLLSYLTERSLIEAEATFNASGKNIITYHLTARGLQFLDKLLELLELLWTGDADRNETR